MTTHTDRIRQMAQEAHNWTDEAMMSDASLIDPEAWSTAMYARFAQLVAEDLTADDDALAEKMAEHLYGHPRSDAVEWAKEDKFDSDKDKALDLIAVMREHIRALYSLKD